MNRNNTERQACRECRDALRTIRTLQPRPALTMDQGRALDAAKRTLDGWRKAYPSGIPGGGEFHFGIPEQ